MGERTEESDIPFGFASAKEWQDSEVARLTAEVERLQARAEHDRETLTPIENAFEAVGGDLVDEVLGLRAETTRMPDPDHVPAVRRVVAWGTWHRLDEPYASVDDAYFDAAHDLLNKARIHKGASYESYMRHWPPDRVLKLADALRHRDEEAGWR